MKLPAAGAGRVAAPGAATGWRQSRGGVAGTSSDPVQAESQVVLGKLRR